jgi:hypothetical protein
MSHENLAPDQATIVVGAADHELSSRGDVPNRHHFAYDVKTVAALMPNLDNLKTRPMQYLRWHRQRYHPVAAAIIAATASASAP